MTPGSSHTTILGRLPVLAYVSWGKDADTPDSYGEYWSEVDAIHWATRDGSPGAEISQKLYDRAEKYDPYFCNLIENVSEMLAYEAWAERWNNQQMINFAFAQTEE